MEKTVHYATAASSDNPAVGLRAVASLRRVVDQLESLQVDRARALGWSWAEIAGALGVSKQAVHQKHGSAHRTDPAKRDQQHPA